MTVSSDARTLSASVHALSGSTPPGSAPVLQPFGVATASAGVAEMPETFAPLGPIVVGLAGRLPLLNKLRSRAISRLERWGLQLAAMRPVTQAGLRAKAAASMAVAEDGVLPDDWRQRLAVSVSEDALRIIQVPAVAPAHGSPLHRFRADHERAALRRDAAYEAWTAAEGKYDQPPLPDALRFRTETDASAVGCYQNRYHPFGYTDARQIEVLRRVSYSRPVHIARRDEILSAYDEWAADCHAASAAAGIGASRDHFYALSNAASAIRRQMIDARATTVDDLWHKVAVVLECFSGIKGIEEEMAEEENQNAAGRETLGLSILLDLGRMLERQDAAVQPPASNIRPVTLVPLDFPAGRYPAGTSREVIETYRTFLDMELRYLNHEVYGRTEGRMHLWLDNPAGALHGPREPAASSRAAAELSLLGLMPTEGVRGKAQADGLAHAAASAA